jgi:uncharacterized protein (TIGR02996 family)
MADDRAFIQAIRVSPQDDLLRLVYADWLEDHDDPVRAELLRIVGESTTGAERQDLAGARRKRFQQLATRVDTHWFAAVTGLKVALVQVSFRLAAKSSASFADSLEVSLDCCVCRRCRRTVIFQAGGAEGICTPTGHAFPGFWLGKEESHEGEVASVRYRVAFRFEPFIDVKHPQLRQPVAMPDWARARFEVVCSRCGQANQASTQNNIVRPWTCHCECGQVLYTETEEMPVLSQIESGEPDAAADGHAMTV